MPARFSRTARTIATRAPSTPFTMRRGFGAAVAIVSACLHLYRQCTPALERDRHARAGLDAAVSRKSALGSATSAMPEPVMSKHPTSSVGPKTVLERTHEPQRGLPVALELADDVDEVLEQRGPAIVPSFVTCPTMITGETAFLRDAE